jgi:hypothetical protein
MLLLLLLLTGAAVCASGQLVASPGAKQAVELKADKLTLVGGCDAESYPLQKVRWQGYMLQCHTEGEWFGISLSRVVHAAVWCSTVHLLSSMAQVQWLAWYLMIVGCSGGESAILT